MLSTAQWKGWTTTTQLQLGGEYTTCVRERPRPARFAGMETDVASRSLQSLPRRYRTHVEGLGGTKGSQRLGTYTTHSYFLFNFGRVLKEGVRRAQQRQSCNREAVS